MKLYHATDHAEEILTGGFRDGKGNYLTREVRYGVFFSDEPVSCCEAARGGLVVLTISIPAAVLKPHEWPETGDDGEKKPYREFFVPASVANKYGPPRIHEATFQWKGRVFLERQATLAERQGNNKHAAKIRKQLLFLEKYDLLEEQPRTSRSRRRPFRRARRGTSGK